MVIDLCQGRISELEHIIEAQAQAIVRLKERMEEVACKCRAQDKGKGKQRAVVPDSPVLGSPIVLTHTSDPEESSDSSYVVTHRDSLVIVCSILHHVYSISPFYA